MTTARSDPRPVEREGYLRWIRLPDELEPWHLAFNVHEAICGEQKFSLRVGWVTRTLSMGPPEGVHHPCQDEMRRRLGLGLEP